MSENKTFMKVHVHAYTDIKTQTTYKGKLCAFSILL